MHSIRKIFPFLSTVTDSRNTFRLRFVFGMFLERNRWIGSSSGMSTASSDCRICMSEIRFANCTNRILDNISLNNDVEIAELRLPDIYVGRSVLEMDLRRKAGLNIIALQHSGKTEIEVDPEYVFREDDILVVIGKKENIRKFEKDKDE